MCNETVVPPAVGIRGALSVLHLGDIQLYAKVWAPLRKICTLLIFEVNKTPAEKQHGLLLRSRSVAKIACKTNS